MRSSHTITSLKGNGTAKTEFLVYAGLQAVKDFLTDIHRNCTRRSTIPVGQLAVDLCTMHYIGVLQGGRALSAV